MEIAQAIMTNLVIPLLIEDRKRVYNSSLRAMMPIVNSLETLMAISHNDDDDDDDDDYVEEDDVLEPENHGRKAISLFSDSDSDEDLPPDLKHISDIYAAHHSKCPAHLEFPSPYAQSKTSNLDSVTLKFTGGEQAKVDSILSHSDSSSTNELEADVRELYATLIARGCVLRKMCSTGPGTDSEAANSTANIPRGLFTLDGDLEQLKVITELLAPLTKQQRLEILKYAGGSSSFQQPNDLMKGFMIFRQFLQSPAYKAWVPDDTTRSVHIGKLEAKLKKDGMEKSSIEGFVKVFHSLDFIVPRCWSMTNVQKGWEMFTATSPGKYDPILRMSSKWEFLTDVQKQKVRDAIHPLAETMATGRGFIDEKIMMNLLGEDILGVPPSPESGSEGSDSDESDAAPRSNKSEGGGGRKRPPPKADGKRKGLEEKTLNRQRAVVVTGTNQRFLIDLRVQIKAMKEIHADLKRAIALVPAPPPPRPSTAPELSTSTSSSSSSSKSAASTTAASASAATATTSQTRPASAPTTSSKRTVKKSQVKDHCQNTDCAGTNTDLTRCPLCYMTFCGDCSTPDARKKHQAGRMCKTLSGGS